MSVKTTCGGEKKRKTVGMCRLYAQKMRTRRKAEEGRKSKERTKRREI